MNDSDHVVAMETVSDERLAGIARGIRTRLSAGGSGAPDTDRDLVSALSELLVSRLAKQAPSWRDVIAERQRQVKAEGWTTTHDDQHDRGEMAAAAGCYALGSRLKTHEVDGPGSYVVPEHWPWDGEWWKTKTRRQDLVRAGALILAEIERLDRLSHTAGEIEAGGEVERIDLPANADLIDCLKRGIRYLSRTTLAGSQEVNDFDAMGDRILANEGDVHSMNMFAPIAASRIEAADKRIAELEAALHLSAQRTEHVDPFVRADAIRAAAVLKAPQ